MVAKIKYILAFVLFAFPKAGLAQTTPDQLDNILSFEEYLGYVKQHHPLMKQAELTLSVGEANLLRSEEHT